MKAMIYYTIEVPELGGGKIKSKAVKAKNTMINLAKNQLGCKFKWNRLTDSAESINVTIDESGDVVTNITFPPQKTDFKFNCLVLYDETENGEFVLRHVEFFVAVELGPNINVESVRIIIKGETIGNA